jgi:hypothetical protein
MCHYLSITEYDAFCYFYYLKANIPAIDSDRHYRHINKDIFFHCLYSIFTTPVFQLQEYKTMFTILLLCLVGIAVAQQPKPCTSPPQWEGRIFDSNEQRKISLQGRVSYDSVYHRVRAIENIEGSGEDIALDVLTLYDAKLQFVYDLKYRNCTRLTVTEPWLDFGILPDAVSRGEAYLGSSALPGGGLLVTMWFV